MRENTQYTVAPQGVYLHKNDKNGQYTLEEEMGNVAAFGPWNFWVESVSFQKLYVLFFFVEISWETWRHLTQNVWFNNQRLPQNIYVFFVRLR